MTENRCHNMLRNGFSRLFDFTFETDRIFGVRGRRLKCRYSRPLRHTVFARKKFVRFCFQSRFCDGWDDSKPTTKYYDRVLVYIEYCGFNGFSRPTFSPRLLPPSPRRRIVKLASGLHPPNKPFDGSTALDIFFFRTLKGSPKKTTTFIPYDKRLLSSVNDNVSIFRVRRANSHRRLSGASHARRKPVG